MGARFAPGFTVTELTMRGRTASGKTVGKTVKSPPITAKVSDEGQPRIYGYYDYVADGHTRRVILLGGQFALEGETLQLFFDWEVGAGRRGTAIVDLPPLGSDMKRFLHGAAIKISGTMNIGERSVSEIYLTIERKLTGP